MTERVFRFGPDEGLLGVLTEPATEQANADALAVVWLNAGLLHHVGPFGWYVTLARRLAGHGFVNFRFDLSGIGDSPARNDGGDALACATRDVTEALDVLGARRAVRRFVLVGLCSGAILAQHVAALDERVAGAVLLDGYGHRTPGYYLRHYAARALRWRSWLTAGRRLARAATGRGAGPQRATLLSESFFFDFPPPDQARAELTRAVQRGAHLLFLYTGGVADQYLNHRRQFAEMFGQLDAGATPIEVEYLAEADHLFTAHEQRQGLFTRIETWMRRFQ
jgi:pimeloyl-ACP methyl ester carboxylesterase